MDHKSIKLTESFNRPSPRAEIHVYPLASYHVFDTNDCMVYPFIKRWHPLLSLSLSLPLSLSLSLSLSLWTNKMLNLKVQIWELKIQLCNSYMSTFKGFYRHCVKKYFVINLQRVNINLLKLHTNKHLPPPPIEWHCYSGLAQEG